MCGLAAIFTYVARGAPAPLSALEETVSGLRTARQKITALEASWYMRSHLLRAADWAGMAHSVEIRVPFVDPVLLENLAPSLASADPPGKADMAACSPRPLPPEILARSKTGFAIPIRAWLARKDGGGEERGLRGWARQVYGATA